MALRLPSFKSLEAFIVAAQSMSFTRAASILNISIPAVTRRIQAVESELGITLFERSSRSVKLTPVGERYFSELMPALSRIHQAGESVKTTRPRDVVRICVRPLFATTWLFPRLHRFLADHPSVQVEYETSTHLNFDTGNIDLAIRFGNGSWPGLYAKSLLSVSCYPVCSPSYFRCAPVLKDLDDVFKHQLLGSSHEQDLWPRWLREANLSSTAAHRLIYFDNFQLCYEAALNGLGITIGLDVLSERYLRTGKLVRPFDLEINPLKKFYLICRPRDRDRPVLLSLIEWLTKEAQDWQGSEAADVSGQ